VNSDLSSWINRLFSMQILIGFHMLLENVGGIFGQFKRVCV
jgi:hypothetical protein